MRRGDVVGAREDLLGLGALVFEDEDLADVVQEHDVARVALQDALVGGQRRLGSRRAS